MRMSDLHNFTTFQNSNLIEVKQCVDSMRHHYYGAAMERLPYDTLYFGICFRVQATWFLVSYHTTNGMKNRSKQHKRTCSLARPKSRSCSSSAELWQDRTAAFGPGIGCCHPILNPAPLRRYHSGLLPGCSKSSQISGHQQSAHSRPCPRDRHFP